MHRPRCAHSRRTGWLSHGRRLSGAQVGVGAVPTAVGATRPGTRSSRRPRHKLTTACVGGFSRCLTRNASWVRAVAAGNNTATSPVLTNSSQSQQTGAASGGQGSTTRQGGDPSQGTSGVEGLGAQTSPRCVCCEDGKAEEGHIGQRRPHPEHVRCECAHDSVEQRLACSCEMRVCCLRWKESFANVSRKNRPRWKLRKPRMSSTCCC